MIFQGNRFDVMEPFTDQMRPTNSDREKGKQSFQSFGVSQMSGFKTAATGFQTSEPGLDLPAFLVISQRSFGMFLGGNNDSLTIRHFEAD